MDEIWRPVLGFEDYYEVSDLGRVKSLERRCRAHYTGTRLVKPRILKPQRDGRTCGGIGAHVHVSLSMEGVVTQRQVHTLVLNAFVGPRPPGYETRHLNGIPDDNRLTNICWGTPEENRADTLRHNTLRRGSRKPNAKLHETDIPVIRANYAAGMSQPMLARRFGVTRGTIDQLLRGRAWTHV